MIVNYNGNYKVRNQIIFGEASEWQDIKRFKGLSLMKLKELIQNNFIGSEESQNCSPTVGTFIELMERYPKLTAHGYCVTHQREDYRVSIEGIEFHGKVENNMLIDFVNLCRQADEFTANENHLYAWWD